MLLRDIMTTTIHMVQPDTSVQQAAHLMAEFNIGELPVGDQDHLLGLVTDRDITVRATAEGRDPRTTPVSDIMTRNLVCCLEGQDVSDAAHMMEANQVRRVLVKNQLDQLVGVVSLGDLAVRRDTEKMAEKVLHCVSESHGQQSYM